MRVQCAVTGGVVGEGRGAEEWEKEGAGGRRGSASPGRRATRIPENFVVTAEMVEWAREHTPSVGRTETEKFVDYWRAKPGQAATKRDWVATWRNWMRRAQEDAERRRPSRTAQTTKASRIEALDAFLTDDQDPAAGHLRALPGGAA